ncbi:hypothetical protein HMPREF1199_01541 [Hoylesella oralis CC98A]|nr:hypothetical protein HMPREF1199_01541 [Hoylesella oralis CC98A]
MLLHAICLEKVPAKGVAALYIRYQKLPPENC